mgnify:CR=1 FL=1
MNHLKQLSLVVAILFLSLLTSVGLSYVITPGAQATTVTQKAETNPPKKTEVGAHKQQHNDSRGDHVK